MVCAAKRKSIRNTSTSSPKKCACPARLHLWADGLMITKPAVWESVQYNCVATQSAFRDDVNGQRASAKPFIWLSACKRFPMARAPLWKPVTTVSHGQTREDHRFNSPNDSDQSLERVSPERGCHLTHGVMQASPSLAQSDVWDLESLPQNSQKETS